MSRHRIQSTLLSILVAASCGLALARPVAAAQDTGQEPSPVWRALLVGINEYRSPDIADLRGAVNDVEAMQSLLVARFGMSPANVTVLTDEEATRANILEALQRLVDETGPADLAFFHYAGHGARVADQDGDEPDGKDGTLVPHDGRTGEVPDITDDELGRILAQFPDDAAIVVLDSCHSGTGTRSLGVRARNIEEDRRVELYARSAARNASGTRALVSVSGAGHVLFTGAAEEEYALDGEVEGKPHGAFTYALVTSLAAAPLDVTADELRLRIEQRMDRIGEQWMIPSMPEPQLEVRPERKDRPLLPARSAGEKLGRLGWVSVGTEPASDLVFLDARAAGVVPGTLWRLYPPGETRFGFDGAVASAEVLRIEGVRAVVSLEPRGARIEDGSRAVASAPAAASHEISVYVSGLTAERTQALADELRRYLPGVRTVGRDEFAQLIVMFEEPHCNVFGADGSSRVASFPVHGDELPAERLGRVLARCQKTFALLALDNPASNLRVEVEIERPPAGAGNRGAKLMVRPKTPVLHVYQQGQARTLENHLQLSVRASADCFLTIVDVDAEGAVNLLFPNGRSQKAGFHTDGFVSGGIRHRIPDSLEPGNQAGFLWATNPPAGCDTIRVFASTTLEHAEELRRTALKLSDTVGDVNALRRSLATRGFQVTDASAEALSASASAQPSIPRETPGGSTAGAPEDWAAASLTVRIELNGTRRATGEGQ